MRVFASRAAAGRELAPLVHAWAAKTQAAQVVVLGIGPDGLPVAEAVATACEVAVHPVAVSEVGDQLLVGTLPDVAGAAVVVVDAGVETGAAAQALAGALQPLGAFSTLLAVPVCPRQALANLRLAYDEVIALDTPLARRSLRWHYEHLEAGEPNATDAGDDRAAPRP